MDRPISVLTDKVTQVGISSLEAAAILIGQCTSNAALDLARVSFDKWRAGVMRLEMIPLGEMQCPSGSTSTAPPSRIGSVRSNASVPPLAASTSKCSPLSEPNAVSLESSGSMDLSYAWGTSVPIALSFDADALTDDRPIGENSPTNGVDSWRPHLIRLAVFVSSVLIVSLIIKPEYNLAAMSALGTFFALKFSARLDNRHVVPVLYRLCELLRIILMRSRRR